MRLSVPGGCDRCGRAQTHYCNSCMTDMHRDCERLRAENQQLRERLDAYGRVMTADPWQSVVICDHSMQDGETCPKCEGRLAARLRTTSQEVTGICKNEGGNA